MKKLNIAATGYYGSTESWKFVRDAYEMIAEAFGNLIHTDDPVIISGVNVSGSNVSAGYITYQGELMAFQTGVKTDTVVIIEEVTESEYNTNPGQSGTLPTYPTYINRYAKCGQSGEGIAEFDFDDLIRMQELITISEATKQATEFTKGIAEIANQAEANTDTNDTHIITPKKLAGRAATENRKGVAAIATQSEVNTGTDDTKIVTPAKLQEKLNNSTFGVVAEFIIDNVDASGASGSVHFSLSGVNNYAVLASYVIDTQINENDNFHFNWFVKNKSNSGFDFLYEIGSQIGQNEYGKIQIVILKVS
jgi:hypothetical protein